MPSERKQVSVLFVDLCNSTAAVRDADPEEARAYLEAALTRMSDAVEAYGGTVSQLLGDGLLALFGAPVAQEDHALRACLAARAMQQSSRDAVHSASFPAKLRVGIHSGEVIVGVSGKYHWSHYRADGTTIHLASRLESLAEPGSVLVSSATHRLVAEQLEMHSLGMHSIRGLDEPMELFELAALGLGSTAAPLARRRRWAPMVGRSGSLDLLDGLALGAKNGNMRIVGLRGEAGIGKSRVIAEWCAGRALSEFQICTTLARGYAVENAYGLVADLARSLVGFGSGRPSAAAETPDDDKSFPDVPPQHQAALNDLLGDADPGQGWAALSSVVRRRHILDALHWLVRRSLLTGPLLLVLEDIFLADHQSLRVLELLVPRLEGLPVLVCASYRQDFAHRWAESGLFVEHCVASLPECDMRSVANAMLGSDASIHGVLDVLVERADGNAFFLEQLAITLVDEGSLAGIPGAYRLTKPQADIRLPASISANICARVDRLPPAAKSALEAAAVLADPITSELIAAMQECTVQQVESQLSLCVSSGLLAAAYQPDAEGQSARYPFRHALVQQVVMSTLTRPRLKALNQSAFAALRAHHGSGDAESAPKLTRHAFDGEVWDQAAAFAVKSMARCVSRSANKEALRQFDLGLKAASLVESRRLALSLESGLLLEAIGALMPLGKIDTIFANLNRASVIAEQLNDTRCKATVALQTSVFLWMRGSYSQGLTFAIQALDAGQAAERRNLQMAARQSRMMMFHGLGQYAACADEARLVRREYGIELGQHRLMPGWATSPTINLCSFLASALWRLGDYNAAQIMLSQAYAVLESFDHPYSRGLIDFVQGQLWIELGEFDRAEELMRASVELCAANDIPTLMPCSVAILGGVLARNGCAAEAVALLEDAIDRKIYRAGGTYGEFFIRLNLGVALRQVGRLEEAIASGLATLDLAIKGEQHGHSVEAFFEVANTFAVAGRALEARQNFECGLTRAQSFGMTIYVDRISKLLEQQVSVVATLSRGKCRAS